MSRLDLTSMGIPATARSQRRDGPSAPTAAERVMAAELQGRGNGNDALTMMVASMARMVQTGKASDSRWKSN